MSTTYTAHALFRIPLEQSRKDQGTDKIAKAGGEDKVHGTGGGQVVNAAEQHLRSAAEQEKQVSNTPFATMTMLPLQSCLASCHQLWSATKFLASAFSRRLFDTSQHLHYSMTIQIEYFTTSR